MNGQKQYDEWFDKAEKLRERLEGTDPDERIRQIAREEADKRISGVVLPIIFVAALWWISEEYGRGASYALIAAGIGYFIWTVVRLDWDPRHESHLISLQAEDMNRLQLLAEACEAGEQTWFVKEKEYERDKRSVQVVDNERWNGSWRRIHGYMLELQPMSPRRRRKRLLDAAKRARAPLEQGEALAKREGAELTSWARSYLHKIKRP